MFFMIVLSFRVNIVQIIYFLKLILIRYDKFDENYLFYKFFLIFPELLKFYNYNC